MQEFEFEEELSKLAVVGLVLPMTTADTEKCSSTMKRIKSDLRNWLRMVYPRCSNEVGY